MIRAPRIRVVDDTGTLGVMTVERALLIARDRGVDLVEVVRDSRPPVCKVTAYGKFLYDQKKKQKAATQRTSKLKEIRLRPKTGGQDLQTKLRRAADMLSKGDRVRLVMRLRGRERGLIGRWSAQLQGWIAQIPKVGRALTPDVQGRSISVVLEPAPRRSA